MGERKKVRRYDIDLTSRILFLLIFCVIAVLFTLARGSDIMYYAWLPMLLSAMTGGFSFSVTEGFVAQQVAGRLQRRKQQNALVLFRSVLTVCLMADVLIFLLFYLFAGKICGSVPGGGMMAPVLQSFVPAMILFELSGCLSGFLRGIGRTRHARMALWMETFLLLLLGTGCGFYNAYRGEKVGALLRNDDMSAVYCGCGIAAGFAISAAITMIYLTVLCVTGAGRLRRIQSRRDAFLAGAQRTENVREAMLYYLSNVWPAVFVMLLITLGIMAGHRLWLSGVSGKKESIIISAWGGCVGAGLPIAAGVGLLSALPFTHMTAQMEKDLERGRRRTMNVRMSMMLRLSAYVSIPWSAFLFAAAKEVIEVFPNLTFKAQETAVLSLKSGSFLVFFIQTALLTGGFFWRRGERRALAGSAAAGWIAQVIALALLSISGAGITLLCWSMDVFWLVMLPVLYLLGRRRLTRGIGASWLLEDLLIAVCAAAAAIPIELLNDYLIQAMPAIPALLLAAAIYLVLYLVLSIVLHAADLRNVGRIPGGGLVVSLAVLLGAVRLPEES